MYISTTWISTPNLLKLSIKLYQPVPARQSWDQNGWFLQDFSTILESQIDKKRLPPSWTRALRKKTDFKKVVTGWVCLDMLAIGQFSHRPLGFVSCDLSKDFTEPAKASTVMKWEAIQRAEITELVNFSCEIRKGVYKTNIKSNDIN